MNRILICFVLFVCTCSLAPAQTDSITHGSIKKRLNNSSHVKRSAEREKLRSMTRAEARREKDRLKALKHCGQTGKHLAFREAPAADPLYLAHRTFIKVTPSSLLDYYGGMLPIGVEQRLGKGWAVAAEASVPLFYKPVGVPQKTITSDMKFRLEGRKYFNIVCKRRLFLGLEAMVRMQDFNLTASQYTTPYDLYSFNSAQVHKTTYQGALLMGVSQKLSRSFFIDVYFGVGVKHLETNYYNVVNKFRVGDNDSFLGILFEDEDTEQGIYNIPYVSVGFKIAYLIPSGKK